MFAKRLTAYFLLIIMCFQYHVVAAAPQELTELVNSSVIVANNAAVYYVFGQQVKSVDALTLSGSQVRIKADAVNELLAQGVQGVLTVSELESLGLFVYYSAANEFAVVSPDPITARDLDAELIKLFGINVSPLGSDSNDGSPADPVKTLERARALAASYKMAFDFFANNIFVHGGTYYQANPLQLTAADNGLTIQNFGDGEVHIKGSVTLPNNRFDPVSNSSVLNRLPLEARGRVYQIKLTDYTGLLTPYDAMGDVGTFGMVSGTPYYALYADGARQTLARWPNDDWGGVSAVATTQSFKPKNKSITAYHSTDGVMVKGYWGNDWYCDTIPVSGLDAQTNTVTMQQVPKYALTTGARIVLFNLLEELDEAGEWYIDRASAMLYYYPPKDITQGTLDLALNTTSLIQLNGVSDISIEGLTLEGGRGYGIEGNNCNNVSVTDSQIRHMGKTAIHINNATNCTVDGNRLYDLGASGVYIKGGVRITLTPANNLVSNNHVYSYAHNVRTTMPGIRLSGVGNIAEHNIVNDGPHMGIFFEGNDNKVQYNEVYNVLYETGDAGAIYAGRSWSMRGNEVKFNYVHDISSPKGPVNGIYMDDMFSGTYIYGNVLKNVQRGMLIGGGKDIKIVNNVFINTTTSITYDDRGRRTQWFHDEVLPGGAMYTSLKDITNSPQYNSTMWLGRYPELNALINDVALQDSNPEVYDAGLPKNALIANNVYADATGYSNTLNVYSSVSSNKNVASNSGYRANISTVQFTDANSDYSIRSSSPVFTALPAFENIPFSQIGCSNDGGYTAPYCKYPADGDELSSGETLLKWGAASGVRNYKVVVSRNADLSGPVTDAYVNNTDYKLNRLKAGKYYWRVDALYFDGSVAAAGEVSHFTVTDELKVDFNNTSDTIFGTVPPYMTLVTKSDSDSARIDSGTLHIQKTVANKLTVSIDSNAAATGAINIEYDIKVIDADSNSSFTATVNGSDSQGGSVQLFADTLSALAYRSSLGTTTLVPALQEGTTYHIKYEIHQGRAAVYVNGVRLAEKLLLPAFATIDGISFSAQYAGEYEIDNIAIQKPRYSEIFSYDFNEGYTLGVQPAADDVMTISGSAADALILVATDPYTGSPALKLSKGTGGTDLALNFGLVDPVATGRLCIDYDFRVEKHAKVLRNWGTMFASPSAVKLVYGYSSGNYLRYDSVTYQNAMNLATADTTKYYKVHYDVDLDAHTASIYIDGTLKRTQSYANPQEFYSLLFSIMHNTSNMNSTETGVYWLDNISVKKEKNYVTTTSPYNGERGVHVDANLFLTLNNVMAPTALEQGDITVMCNGTQISPALYTAQIEADNTIRIDFAQKLLYNSQYQVILNQNDFAEGYSFTFDTEDKNDLSLAYNLDFDDYAENTAVNDGAVTVSLPSANDSAVVVVDPKSGSKALRLTKSNDAGNLDVKLNIPTLQSDIVEVSFKFRAATHAKYLQMLGDIIDPSGTPIAGGYIWGNDLFYGNRTTPLLNVSQTDDYITIRSVVRFATHTIDVYCNDVLAYSNLAFTSSSQLSYLHFILRQYKSAVNSMDTGVYYIDDISVSALGVLRVENTDIQAGSAGVPISTESVSFALNAPANADTVNTDTVKVKVNGDFTSNYTATYQVTAQGYYIVVSFENALESGAEYEIILDGVWSTGDFPGKLATYKLDFITKISEAKIHEAVVKDQNNNIVLASNVAEGQYTINFTVSSPQSNYIIIIALKNKDGAVEKMLSHQVVDGDTSSQVTIPVVMNIQGLNQPVQRIECFLWESFEGINPLGEKVIL